MKKLDIASGDAVQIVGQRITSAIALPSYNEIPNDVIYIDGITRQNAEAFVGDYIMIRKAKVKKADKIILAPINETNAHGKFANFIKNCLIGRTFIEGDVISIRVLWQIKNFKVTKTCPNGIVKVTTETKLEISEKPLFKHESLPKIMYENVGGLHKEIIKLREVVEHILGHYDLSQKQSIKHSKGVLLYGPAGCGKTLLALATANELNVNFFHIKGYEVMSKTYKEIVTMLAGAFDYAKKLAPSIIFIDDLDAISVNTRLAAQLLFLMDNLPARGVVVIGATNKPNILDKAFREPRRFENEIEISMPDKQGRYEILQIHTYGVPLTENVNLEKIAEMTQGYTGADLALLCRKATVKALERYFPSTNIRGDIVLFPALENIKVEMNDFLEFLNQ
jgi:transitional endoplasmic reticulum ATPase